jgi:hypothetical protein
MPDVHEHLDFGSRLVIAITAVIFIAAIFFKGFGHDVLLEAGVFLVSVKLIMMAYKNSVAARQLTDRLDGLHETLRRVESTFESRRPSGTAVGLPNQAPQPPDTAYRPADAKGV